MLKISLHSLSQLHPVNPWDSTRAVPLTIPINQDLQRGNSGKTNSRCHIEVEIKDARQVRAGEIGTEEVYISPLSIRFCQISENNGKRWEDNIRPVILGSGDKATITSVAIRDKDTKIAGNLIKSEKVKK